MKFACPCSLGFRASGRRRSRPLARRPPPRPIRSPHGAVQNLQNRGLNLRCTRLSVRLQRHLNDPWTHSVPRQLPCNKQPCRPGSDHQDFCV
jgi:hypothetical protein